jgi:uncharacterized protein (TIGR00369 family)
MKEQKTGKRQKITGAALVSGAQPHGAPVATLIGFEASEVHDGKAIVKLEAGPQHANPMGTLHGRILCDIADAAMGMAFASTLSDHESFITVELKINFFRPIWQARLRAESYNAGTRSDM